MDFGWFRLHQHKRLRLAVSSPVAPRYCLRSFAVTAVFIIEVFIALARQRPTRGRLVQLFLFFSFFCWLIDSWGLVSGVRAWWKSKSVPIERPHLAPRLWAFMWSRRNLRAGSAVEVGELKGSGSFQHSSICPGTLQNHGPPLQRPASRQDPRRGIFLLRVQEERSAWIYSGWGRSESARWRPAGQEDVHSLDLELLRGGAPWKKWCGWRESSKDQNRTTLWFSL